MSERKLKAWQQAGLIDVDAVARIRAWEAEHARPIGVWALVGLGALAVGLGLVSVVAANWDAIPGEARLGLHFALMAALAAFLWWRRPGTSGETDYFSDALLFVVSMLGLTFFAHLGQVYQTSSPVWQPLLAWLLVFTPLLLLFGRGWPVAGLWMTGVLVTAWSHAQEHNAMWILGTHHAQQLTYPTLYWGLIASPPMIVAALAAVMRGHSARILFWRLLEQLALVTILAGVSIIVISWGWGRHSASALGSIAIQSLFLLATAAVIFKARRTLSGQASAGILCVAAAIHFVSALIPYDHDFGTSWTFSQVLRAFLFMALWGAVAFAALHARWRRIFQIAIGLLAMRLIILSFELNNDLLGSGVGLIVSGLIALSIAWASVRLSKKYAPQQEEEA